MKYNLIDDVMNDSVKAYKSSTFVSFFKSQKYLIDVLESFNQSLLTYKEILAADGDPLEYEDDQILAMESLDAFSEYKALENFSEMNPFAFDSANEHLRDGIITLTQNLPSISAIVDAGTILDDNSVERMRAMVATCIAELNHAFVFGYGLLELYRSGVVSDVEIIDVQAQVFTALSDVGADPLEIAKYHFELLSKYRAKVRVFEEFPSLEDPFYEQLGVHVDLFGMYDIYITKEFVDRVVNSNEDLDAIALDFQKHVLDMKAKEDEISSLG